jgi:hypothetical protein
MVNGATGKVEFRFHRFIKQYPCGGFYKDGVDDALLVVNYIETDELFRKFFHNMLVVVDFTKNEVTEIGVNSEGHNLSTTPWVGDLDNDRNLDIIYCHSTNLRHTYDFDGMKVERIATKIPIRKEIKWGAYMGSNYDGVFK